jgi:hypothetical protein
LSVGKYTATDFLCELGNQELGELQFEDVLHNSLKLDDIIPEKWSGKGLEFVPKEFTCCEISIV